MVFQVGAVLDRIRAPGVQISLSKLIMTAKTRLSTVWSGNLFDCTDLMNICH